MSSRLAEWRRILRQGPTQARQVLGRVLDGKIAFTPRPDGLVDYEAPTRLSRLFVGVAPGPKRERGRVPKHFKDGDRRGYQAAQDELERGFEKALEAAESRTRESMVALQRSITFCTDK